MPRAGEIVYNAIKPKLCVVIDCLYDYFTYEDSKKLKINENTAEKN